MPAKIVGLINQKGGCGKTTVAMNLAGCLALNGLRILVADLDKQRSGSVWGRQAKMLDSQFPADYVNLSAISGFAKKLDALKAEYDLIILDTPPAIESVATWDAAMCSDLVLVPVLLDSLHVDAFVKVKELLDQIREQRRKVGLGFENRIVFNAFDRTVLARRSVEDFKTFKFPIAQSVLGDRVVYRSAITFGECVGQTDKNSKAAQEIKSLAAEVLNILKIKR